MTMLVSPPLLRCSAVIASARHNRLHMRAARVACLAALALLPAMPAAAQMTWQKVTVSPPQTGAFCTATITNSTETITWPVTTTFYYSVTGGSGGAGGQGGGGGGGGGGGAGVYYLVGGGAHGR